MSGDLGIYDLIQYWSPITESIVFHCVRAVSEPAKGRLHHCFASLCGRPVYRALTDSLWKTVAIPIGHVNLQCITTLQSKFNSFRFPNSINKGPPGGRWVGVRLKILTTRFLATLYGFIFPIQWMGQRTALLAAQWSPAIIMIMISKFTVVWSGDDFESVKWKI